MWIFLNDAYFSIVHKDCAAHEVLVRARRKGDIERHFLVPATSVDHADYQYRAVIERAWLARVLSEQAYKIDYDNFKDSVRNKSLARTYNAVWAAAGGAARYEEWWAQ